MHYFQNSIVLYLISNDEYADGDGKRDTSAPPMGTEIFVKEACVRSVVVEVAVVVTELT